ncbi:MAG: metallophosphoesterase family protein [Anaerolineaceae bacterium]|nr:metallophosphoesterase family protein [Anaerolineaceae bacterium]
MRIAILADIHGNPLALDAVLADINQRGGVDGYWILGDLCAIGYDPAGVLERLVRLPNTLFVRGNHDRLLVTGERPRPGLEQVRENPDQIPLLAEVAGNFGWTVGYLAATGWLDWLGKLPLEQLVTLPNGERALLVHAAPGTDDGEGLNPALSDGELQTALAESSADLICVGHFHVAMDRRLNGTHIINPGCVSNPLAGDLRAAYALLDATHTDYTVTFHRVDYDRAAAIEATQRSGNPGTDFMVRFLQGEIHADWMAQWDGQTHYPPITE